MLRVLLSVIEHGTLLTPSATYGCFEIHRDLFALCLVQHFCAIKLVCNASVNPQSRGPQCPVARLMKRQRQLTLLWVVALKEALSPLH